MRVEGRVDKSRDGEMKLSFDWPFYLNSIEERSSRRRDSHCACGGGTRGRQVAENTEPHVAPGPDRAHSNGWADVLAASAAFERLRPWRDSR
jgi:hypothetical protein